MKYLANIGARATNQHLQRSATIRRYPILVAFLKQTLFDLTDIVADLFDANLWERHTDAKAELDQMRLQAARSTNEKLRTYKDVVSIVIDGAVPEVAVRQTIFALLQALNESGTRAVPQDAPTGFVSDAWWEYLLDAKGNLSRRYYELAVLWELRLALRSGDIYVEHARRYADPNTYLIPANIWPSQREEVIRLTHTPANGAERLREREAELRHLAERVERLLAGRDGALRREKGKWVLSPLEEEGRPASAQALEDALVARLPRLDITDLLIEVDAWTGYSQRLTHASSGVPVQSEEELTYLYAALLAQGCNFSLAQMSRSSLLAYHRLVYANTCYIQDDTLKKANAALVNYHHELDISRLWGMGTLSSSDGQRFPVTGRSRKARTIRRYFGYHRGITFYTWTSDQFSLYGGKAIASTVRDATYILDEILANETELPILEHTTDTSGYTEIVFALFDLLGLTFTPRIKDLGDQQLYRTANVEFGYCQ